MAFVTKLDYSDNRQIKQFQLTNTKLSGTTEFGVPYSALTGVNMESVEITGTLAGIISTFSGNSSTTNIIFGDTRMFPAAKSLYTITDLTSGDTQTATGYEGVGPTIVDGNVVYSAYTGSTYDFTVTSIEEVGVDEWTGETISNTVSILSGISADFSGRTIWVDVKGITRTEKLFVQDYIDFNTGSTKPINSSGRVFYDNQSHSLSYFPDITQDVKVDTGQQIYLRGFNTTGSIIPKGTVLSVITDGNELPNFIPRIDVHGEYSSVAGIAASDIPNNKEGLALTEGILSGITINDFSVGDILYASPFSAGTYIATTDSFPLSARTNEIGFVLSTGTTEGKIYVRIRNEDGNLTLTTLERNLLEGNVMSTGAYQFTGLTKTSSTTFSVAPVRGWIADNTYEKATNPEVTHIYYTGGTGLNTPYLNTSETTYVLIDENSELTLFPTEPTPQERRENIYLGKIVHPDKTNIQNIGNITDFNISTMSALRDLFTPIKLINDGIIVSPNGVNLSFNTSAGSLFGNGINWSLNELSPNNVIFSGNSPVTFQYRTSTGGTFTNITEIDPLNYDVDGVVTLIPGNFGSQLIRATNQRVYLFPSGVIRVQYGQVWYNTLSEAVAGLLSEVFVEYGSHAENGILIGVISVARESTDLSDTTTTLLARTSKFGELFGGTAGLSTTTLQQAYNNSINPEIITSVLLDGVQFQGGTGNDLDANIVIQNNAGNVTGGWLANGALSATTLSAITISATTYLNLPTDNWDVAYDDSITGMTVTGTITKTITLQQRDGSTITANFNDASGGGSGEEITGMTFNPATGDLDLTTNSGSTITTNLDGRYSLTGHTHVISEISDFPTEVSYFNNDVGYLTAFTDTNIFVSGGTFSSEILEFTNTSGGTFNIDLSNTYSLTGHTHDFNEITNTGHTHTVSEITDFPTDLSAFTNSVGYITGFTNDNIFVTGGTFNDTNGILEFTNTSGDTFTVDLDGRYLTEYTDDYVTGATFNTSDGNLTLSTLSGNSVIENLDGRYLTGFTATINTDDYVSGGTFDIGTGILEFTRVSGGTFNIDLDNRYSLSGHTHDFNEITNTGHTHAISEITDFPTDISYFNNDVGYLTAFTDTNIFVSGATFNDTNGEITYTNTSGGTFTVDIDNRYLLSDDYTPSDNYLTGHTFNTSTGLFESTLQSGSTVSVNLDGRYAFSSGHTHTISDITDFPTDLSAFTNSVGYITGFTNDNIFVSGGTFSSEILEFTNTSGGTFNVDLSNTYSLTGHTHVIADITDYVVVDDYVISGTVTGSNLQLTRLSGGTIDVDVSNLLDNTNTDDYITSGSFNTTNGEVTLTRLSGGTVVYDLDGRYSLTGHTHDMTSKTIDINPTDLTLTATTKSAVIDYINALGYTKTTDNSDLWFKINPNYMLDVSSEADFAGTPTALSVSSGGTVLYLGLHNDNCNQYILSTPWDVTTATFTASTATLGQGGGLHVSSDGLHITYSNRDLTNGSVQIYSMSSPHNLASLSLVSTTAFTENLSGYEIFMTDDGLNLYTSTGSNIKRYTLSTPYDFSGVTLSDSWSINISHGFTFSNDLKTFFVFQAGENLRQYHLMVAGDLTPVVGGTVINEAEFDYIGGNFLRCQISPDGKRFIVTTYLASPDVFSFGLSTTNNIGPVITANDPDLIIYDDYYRLKNYASGLITGVTDDDVDEITQVKNNDVTNLVNLSTVSGNDYLSGATFNTSTGDLTLTMFSGSTIVENLDGRYLTGFTATVNTDDYVTSGAVTGSNLQLTRLSGGTVDIDVSSFLDDTNTDDFTTGATFNDVTGIIEFTRQSGSTFTVDLDGRYALSGTGVYTYSATQRIKPRVGTFTNTGNYSTIAGGSGNTITTQNSFIGGGRGNTASGSSYSFIGGGQDNITSGQASFIGGGETNTVSGLRAFLGGGYGNIASGTYSAILGGLQNEVTAQYSTIGGGRNNTVSNNYSNIGGGKNNTVNNSNSFIGGGDTNLANGQTSFIGGGFGNTTSGMYSVISGGQTNTVSERASFIGGGQDNIASGMYSIIGGGRDNTVSDTYSFIGGGRNNTVSSYYSTIGGGYGNNVSNYYSTIGGGNTNTASGSYSTVSGGYSNISGGYTSTISGGYRNEILAFANSSTISGGYSNTVSGGYSTISGGYGNNVSGNFSSSTSGQYNTVTHNNSHIIGSNLTSTQDDTTFVENLIASGNVGIGTTSPAAKLHISSGNGVNGNCEVIIESDTDNLVETSNPKLILKQDGGAVVGNFGITGWVTDYTNALENATFLGSTGAFPLQLITNNTARISVNGSTGNVGIGTTNPIYTLDVSGTSRFTGNLTLDTTTNQPSETTALMIDGSGIVGTRELGSGAFVASGASNTNNFVTGHTFNATNGLFETTLQSGNTISVNLDGRYSLTGHIHPEFNNFGDYLPLSGGTLTGPLTGTTFNISDALLDYQENIDVDSAASEVVATVSKLIYDAIFFDYVVKNGSNLRAGIIMAAHDGTSVTYTDTSTADLGDTSGVVFTVNISGNDLRLIASVSTDNWIIKTLLRGI